MVSVCIQYKSERESKQTSKQTRCDATTLCFARYLANSGVVCNQSLSVLAQGVNVLHVGADSQDLLLGGAKDIKGLACFLHLVLDSNLELLVNNGLLADELLTHGGERGEVVWMLEHRSNDGDLCVRRDGDDGLCVHHR